MPSHIKAFQSFLSQYSSQTHFTIQDWTQFFHDFDKWMTLETSGSVKSRSPFSNLILQSILTGADRRVFRLIAMRQLFSQQDSCVSSDLFGKTLEHNYREEEKSKALWERACAERENGDSSFQETEKHAQNSVGAQLAIGISVQMPYNKTVSFKHSRALESMKVVLNNSLLIKLYREIEQHFLQQPFLPKALKQQDREEQRWGLFTPSARTIGEQVFQEFLDLYFPLGQSAASSQANPAFLLHHAAQMYFHSHQECSMQPIGSKIFDYFLFLLTQEPIEFASPVKTVLMEICQNYLSLYQITGDHKIQSPDQGDLAFLTEIHCLQPNMGLFAQMLQGRDFLQELRVFKAAVLAADLSTPSPFTDPSDSQERISPSDLSLSSSSLCFDIGSGIHLDAWADGLSSPMSRISSDIRGRGRSVSTGAFSIGLANTSSETLDSLRVDSPIRGASIDWPPGIAFQIELLLPFAQEISSLPCFYRELTQWTRSFPKEILSFEAYHQQVLRQQEARVAQNHLLDFERWFWYPDFSLSLQWTPWARKVLESQFQAGLDLAHLAFECEPIFCLLNPNFHPIDRSLLVESVDELALTPHLFANFAIAQILRDKKIRSSDRVLARAIENHSVNFSNPKAGLAWLAMVFYDDSFLALLAMTPFRSESELLECLIPIVIHRESIRALHNCDSNPLLQKVLPQFQDAILKLSSTSWMQIYQVLEPVHQCDWLKYVFSHIHHSDGESFQRALEAQSDETLVLEKTVYYKILMQGNIGALLWALAQRTSNAIMTAKTRQEETLFTLFMADPLSVFYLESQEFPQKGRTDRISLHEFWLNNLAVQQSIEANPHLARVYLARAYQANYSYTSLVELLPKNLQSLYTEILKMRVYKACDLLIGAVCNQNINVYEELLENRPYAYQAAFNRLLIDCLKKGLFAEAYEQYTLVYKETPLLSALKKKETADELAMTVHYSSNLLVLSYDTRYSQESFALAYKIYGAGALSLQLLPNLAMQQWLHGLRQDLLDSPSKLEARTLYETTLAICLELQNIAPWIKNIGHFCLLMESLPLDPAQKNSQKPEGYHQWLLQILQKALIDRTVSLPEGFFTQENSQGNTLLFEMVKSVFWKRELEKRAYSELLKRLLEVTPARNHQGQSLLMAATIAKASERLLWALVEDQCSKTRRFDPQESEIQYVMEALLEQDCGGRSVCSLVQIPAALSTEDLQQCSHFGQVVFLCSLQDFSSALSWKIGLDFLLRHPKTSEKDLIWYFRRNPQITDFILDKGHSLWNICLLKGYDRLWREMIEHVQKEWMSQPISTPRGPVLFGAHCLAMVFGTNSEPEPSQGVAPKIKAMLEREIHPALPLAERSCWALLNNATAQDLFYPLAKNFLQWYRKIEPQPPLVIGKKCL